MFSYVEYDHSHMQAYYVQDTILGCAIVRNRFVKYNKTNGITPIKTHVDH
jgi:hypothetical protein